MIIAAQLLILDYQCWKQFLLVIMHKLWYIFQDLLILKEKHLFEIDIFHTIINAFTVTFDQFNASSQNKVINFLCTL